MNFKKFVYAFSFPATVYLVNQFIFNPLGLYVQYYWFDIPMHFIGGSVVALGYLSARDFIPKLPRRLFVFVPTIIFVFSIAILWELFELVAGITMQNGYMVDTVADVIFGLIGGSVGYFVGSRIREII